MSVYSSLNTPVVIAAAVATFVVVLLVLYFFRKGKRASGDTNSSTNNQIYVGNLSYRVKEHHLRDFFACFGDIDNLKIIKNHNTGRSRGYGFITFKKEGFAASSLDYNGKEFEGRALVVRIARPK